MKGLTGVPLSGLQQCECPPSHLHTWLSHLGLDLAAMEKGRQEETREKEACVSHQKTTRTGEMAAPRRQKAEAWRRGRGETLLTFSSPGGLRTGRKATAVEMVTTTTTTGVVQLHRALARELHQGIIIIWGTRGKFWL